MPITPFIESLPIYTQISASMSNSIDTSGIDSYRQGVELTLDRHFQQGMVKISAGEPNHQLPQRSLGELQDQIHPESPSFIELDYFNPVTFITAQGYGTLAASLTYPIVFFAGLGNTDDLMDGAMEPLTIRRASHFSSLDAPMEAHAVHGNIESANFNGLVHGDMIVSKVRFKEETRGSSPYEDNVDLFNSQPINIGYFPNISRYIAPFSDSQKYSEVVQSVNLSATMISATNHMTGNSDNYVTAFSKVTTNGFTWYNTLGHGDSLAFGNLTFKNKLFPTGVLGNPYL